MQVGDIMTKDVKTIGGDASFAQAAKILHENGISSVVVTGDGGPEGIVTERDLVNVVAEGLDPGSTRVGDRMTRDLATIGSRSDVAEAARIMGERRIRHLPVVDKGQLAGIVSIRDVTSWAVSEMTGGHELPDLERSSAALTGVVEAKKD